MSITAEIKISQLQRLTKSIKGVKTNLPKEIAAAINATSALARSGKNKDGVSRRIREKVVIQAGELNKLIKSRRATPTQLVGSVDLKKTARPSLRAFGARQGKAGVTYRIQKAGGRKLAAGAFQGPRPGAMKASWRGHVFKRVGKSRLPIRKLMGPSPWGVFVKNRMSVEQIASINSDLAKQMHRRIRENLLRASGLIQSRR